MAIYAQGARGFGLVQADRYHDALFDQFDLLAAFPRMARERTELDPPVRVHPFRAHLILYRVEPDDSILILRVRHGREDWTAPPA